MTSCDTSSSPTNASAPMIGPCSAPSPPTVEAGRTLLLDRAEMLEAANESDIAIVGIEA